MEKYRLQSLILLTSDRGSRFLDTIDCVELCNDMESAENHLQMKISEKLSNYSKMGLNWKILEKKVTIDREDKDGFLKKGFNLMV